MKRYEKYKPSGIDWIGEVPEHWEVTRCRFISRLLHGMSYTPKDVVSEGEGTLVLRASNIQDSKLAFDDNVFIPSEMIPAQKMTRKGDIVICSTNGSLALCGKSALVKEDGLNLSFGSFMMVMRTDQNPIFIQYQLSQMVDLYRGLFATTTINQLTMDMLKDFSFILPPLAEQEAIAAYLDARCADIDKVVATQEKRIALLQELKQSEITQAVTRGLNPDARMKDSGVEWIGMVPEHWEVIPFKSKFKTDKGLSITKADLVDEGVPVISYGQIHSKQNDYVHTLDHLLRFIPEEMAPADSKAKLEIGDIVFADTSEDVEGSGNAFYIDREGIYAGYHTVIAKSIERVDNKYFAYLFATPVWRSQVRSQVYGVKVFSITQQILKSTSLIAPPVEERKQIVEVLEEKCARIDKQIEKIQNQIELLREYKQALITEVVTGKRKV